MQESSISQKVAALINLFVNAQDNEDRFFTSVMLLSAMTPYGVSDVLNLKHDALSSDGAIQWNSKAASGKMAIEPAFLPWVKVAIARLIEISQEPRACATFSGAHPDLYRRHDCAVPADKAEQDALTDPELVSVLQADRKRLSLSQFKNIKWLKALTEKTGDKISYAALAGHANATYRGAHWPYTDATEKLRFDQALCLLREHEFHADFSIRRYSWIMPTADMINNKFKQKQGGGTANTLWKKHGVTNPDGTPLSLLSGELRKFYQQQRQAFYSLLVSAGRL